MIRNSHLPKQMAESIHTLSLPAEEQLRRFGATVQVHILDDQLHIAGSMMSMHQFDSNVEPLIRTSEIV
jgi:hypothetical protein